MLLALERERPAGWSWSRPDGGYFVWLDLPGDPDTAELLVQATEAGVTFVPGADFFPGGRDGRSAVRLAFSFASPDEIGEGVARRAALVPHPAAV